MKKIWMLIGDKMIYTFEHLRNAQEVQKLEQFSDYELVLLRNVPCGEGCVGWEICYNAPTPFDGRKAVREESERRLERMEGKLDALLAVLAEECEDVKNPYASLDDIPGEDVPPAPGLDGEGSL